MPYSDDYTTLNAPDVESLFRNSDNETISETASDEMHTRVEAVLVAADTMLAAAWKLITSCKLDCARDILAGPSDLISEWVYCATGSNYQTIFDEYGIDVWEMEKQHPEIVSTREALKRMTA